MALAAAMLNWRYSCPYGLLIWMQQHHLGSCLKTFKKFLKRCFESVLKKLQIFLIVLQNLQYLKVNNQTSEKYLSYYKVNELLGIIILCLTSNYILSMSTNLYKWEEEFFEYHLICSHRWKSLKSGLANGLREWFPYHSRNCY